MIRVAALDVNFRGGGALTPVDSKTTRVNMHKGNDGYVDVSADDFFHMYDLFQERVHGNSESRAIKTKK